MITERHPLTEQVEELFLSSELSPTITNDLLDTVDQYFKDKTVEIGDHLPSVINNLYAIEDHKLYSIISICYRDRYEAVLIPSLVHFILHVQKGVLNRVKLSEQYQGVELGKVVSNVNKLLRLIYETLGSSMVTTRRAVGVDEKAPVVFPDVETLKVFYECKRKVKYASKVEAEQAMVSRYEAYRCLHCSHYHVGQPSVTGVTLPESVRLARYKRVWRRYHKI